MNRKKGRKRENKRQEGGKNKGEEIFHSLRVTQLVHMRTVLYRCGLRVRAFSTSGLAIRLLYLTSIEEAERGCHLSIVFSRSQLAGFA